MKAAPAAVGRLARAAARDRDHALSDAALLLRFQRDRDGDAFAALVERHGRMVLGLCRRIAGDQHLAEDAFQAVFLTLSRKAGAIRRLEALPTWLFGVARRIALKARADRDRRQTLPPCDAVGFETDPLDRLSVREMLDVLDDELGRLPLCYRSALILCTLEGKSIEETARHLGATAGAVRGWLQRGRERLRERLARRGLELPVVLAASVLLTREGVAASLVRAAVRIGTSAGSAPPVIGALSRTSVSVIVKLASIALLAAGAAGVGLALMPINKASSELPVQTARKAADADPAVETKEVPRVDRFGDPLPDRVIARLGTTRLGHGDTIYGIAFSGDNRSLASGGVGFVNIWDTNTAQRRLQVYDTNFAKMYGFGIASGVALSADGALLAVAWCNSPPELWEVGAGKKLHSIGNPNYRASGVQFSDDGKYLTASPRDKDGMAIVAEVKTGKVIYASAGKIFLLPGSFIHLDPGQSEVSLRKLEDDKVKIRFTGHTGSVRDAALTLEETRLFTHGSDRTIRVWDTATGRELRRLDNTPENPCSLVPAPDAKSVLTLVSGQSTMQCWDVESGDLRWTAKADGNAGFVHASFLPGGDTVVTGHVDGGLRQWDIKTGKAQKAARSNFDGTVSCMALSPDGRTLATTSNCNQNDGNVHLFDAATLTPKFGQQGHTQIIVASACSPDGRLIATSGIDRSVRLWDLQTGNPIWALKAPTNKCKSLTFAPDGKKFVTGNRVGEVQFWDVETGKEIRKFRCDPEGPVLLAMSPDGKRILTCGSDNRLRCWDATTFKQLGEFEDNEPRAVRRLALSPDGATLVTGNLDPTVRVWDARTFKKRYQLTGKSGGIGAIAFSPDSSLLAWSDEGIRLTDVASGEEVRRLGSPSGSFDRIAFAPDGKTLAWGIAMGLLQAPRAVQVWEVRTGGLRRTLDGHDGPAEPLAFSPKGGLLVTAGSDGSALVWDLGHRWTGKRADGLPSDQKLAECWDGLAATDAARAFTCMEVFEQFPAQSVATIAGRLKRMHHVAAHKIRELLRDLDSDTFKVRDAAASELERLGELALPDLRVAAAKGGTVETQGKAERLIKRIEAGQLQRERAVEVLEMIGDHAAIELLRSLASGHPEAPLTRDAKAALSRLQGEPQANRASGR